MRFDGAKGFDWGGEGRFDPGRMKSERKMFVDSFCLTFHPD